MGIEEVVEDEQEYAENENSEDEYWTLISVE